MAVGPGASSETPAPPVVKAPKTTGATPVGAPASVVPPPEGVTSGDAVGVEASAGVAPPSEPSDAELAEQARLQKRDALVDSWRGKLRRETGGIDAAKEAKFDAAVTDLQTPLESDDPEIVEAGLEKILAAKETLEVGLRDFHDYFEGDDRWDTVADKYVEKGIESLESLLSDGDEEVSAIAQGQKEALQQGLHALLTGDHAEAMDGAAALLPFASHPAFAEQGGVPYVFSQFGFKMDNPADQQFLQDVQQYAQKQQETAQLTAAVDTDTVPPAPVDGDANPVPEQPDPAPMDGENPDGEPATPDPAPAIPPTPEQERAAMDGAVDIAKTAMDPKASKEDKEKAKKSLKEWCKKHPFLTTALIAASPPGALLLPTLLILLLGLAASASKG